MIELDAGSPLEAPAHPVGRRSGVLVDAGRADRTLPFEVWYPADAGGSERTVYEVIPGVGVRSAIARPDATPMAGPFPLVLFSHGRTGTRIAYATLCEAIAARGAVVVSADHPGDSLFDWLTGSFTDDRTNEVNRVADAHLLLGALLDERPESSVVPASLRRSIDRSHVVLAGHSYGAYTAMATAAGSRGVPAHQAVTAVVAFQGYTRTMSDALLERLDLPTLLVVATGDTVTPPETDGERPWALLPCTPCWRLDLIGAGHQAASDIARYAELAGHVPLIPPLVRDYLESTAAVGPGTPPWRPVLQLQVEVFWQFLRATSARHDDGLVPARRAVETSGFGRLRHR